MADVLIALGGNVGDVRATFQKAIANICGMTQAALLARSSDYATPPWGDEQQARFINACIEIETGLDPHALLFTLHKIEVRFGRDRTKETRWGPRTLDLDLSVEQNLRYHAALHGIGAAETKARSADVLAKVDMLDRVNDKVRSLSGGQMRRVEIARALLHRPRLLVLDEPTVGLDIGARAGILRLVRGLIASEGMSVLWATHLTDEVDANTDLRRRR